MQILWFTWKDRTHPHAGGAEAINEELAKRLVADGHQVKLLVGGYKGGKPTEMSPDGYEIIRVGNRLSVYWQAYRYYKKQLRGWADLVIDEVNTVPFFAKFYVREPNILFVHQLCRKIWFYELFQSLSTIGYLLEPVYLRLLNDRKVITVSESTKQDLQRLGFRPDSIHIISEGLENPPLQMLPPLNTKEKQPTVLSLGNIRPMKRTLHQLQAFEIAKQNIPDLKMIVAGNAKGRYGRKFLQTIAKSPYASDISYRGKVSQNVKLDLMKSCHLITVTSVKEGWGLIVTEAASQGTPAVVYNVDGLRDSVRDGQTGYVCEHNTPQELAANITKLLEAPAVYRGVRQAAWQWSKQITFEQSFADFRKGIGA